ncbi:Fructose-bisphosphate aldolase [Cucumispora dikerogammari]|nr:Fructose-bisphosphate aldolase [Cucumispora dikerogammari]
MTKNKEIHIRQTAIELISDGGILAMDERPSSFDKKLSPLNLPTTKEMRYEIRSKIFKAPNLHRIIKGIILHEETFIQKIDQIFIPEYLRKKNILVGLKVDQGVKQMPSNELESTGLDKLEYLLKNPIFKMASFLKWRCIFKISHLTPTNEHIDNSCMIMAKYAKIAQSYNKVPIIEPEILWEGEYNLSKSIVITKKILSHLIFHLNLEGVLIPAVLIKMGFVSRGQVMGITDIEETAVATLSVIESTLPMGLPGVVFLSGGRGQKECLMVLNKINSQSMEKSCKLSFSFGRAITNKVLELISYGAKDEKIYKYIDKIMNDLDLALKGMLKFE